MGHAPLLVFTTHNRFWRRTVVDDICSIPHDLRSATCASYNNEGRNSCVNFKFSAYFTRVSRCCCCLVSLWMRTLTLPVLPVPVPLPPLHCTSFSSHHISRGSRDLLVIRKLELYLVKYLIASWSSSLSIRAPSRPVLNLVLYRFIDTELSLEYCTVFREGQYLYLSSRIGHFVECSYPRHVCWQ